MYGDVNLLHIFVWLQYVLSDWSGETGIFVDHSALEGGVCEDTVARIYLKIENLLLAQYSTLHLWYLWPGFSNSTRQASHSWTNCTVLCNNIALEYFILTSLYRSCLCTHNLLYYTDTIYSLYGTEKENEGGRKAGRFKINLITQFLLL